MIKKNWREMTPTIVHNVGIDYKLLLGQEKKDPALEYACMEGMLYLAYAMLQPGKTYEAHSHDDHEEVYYVIEGRGEMDIDGEVVPIRDGDAIYIAKNQSHSISNTDENDFLRFLAFSAQC